MTITPSDSLDALIARGPPDATDFAKQIAGLPGAYYAGLDEAYKRRTQDAFQNGVPMTANGQVDLPSVYKTILTTGGTPAGIEVAKGLQAQETQRALQGLAGSVFGGDQPPVVPGAPPSTASTSVAAPALRPTSGPPGSSNGSSPTSVNAAVSQAGFSEAEAGSLMTRIAQGLGVDPDQNLDPVKQAQVTTAVQRAIQAKRPQQPPTTAPPPSATPSAEGMATVTNDPTLGGLVPPGRTYVQQLKMLQQSAALAESGQKGAGKPYADAAAKIEERLLPTTEYKNYLAGKRPGETFPDWLDRNSRDKEKLAILEKSIIPEINESKKGANSATKDIEAIGQVTEQLNANKGIISGIRAGDRLTLQKVGSLLGFDGEQVANTEAFRAAMGQRVASVIKAFGSGTAISEGDRKYTQQMVGGQIDLDEKSIRKILDIGQRAAQATINRHNDLVDRTLKATPALQGYRDVYRVEAPTVGRTAQPPVPGAKQAPDGNFYIPDPNRPGKYLQVK